MKRLTVFLLTTTLIALVAVSCELFGKAKPASANFLEGIWRLDSVHTDKDSGDAALAMLLFAFAKSDSNRIGFQFTKDSIFTLENDSVTERQPYTFDAERLEVRSIDSVNQVFTYQQIADSLLVLKSKDSVTMHLRRQ